MDLEAFVAVFFGDDFEAVFVVGFAVVFVAGFAEEVFAERVVDLEADFVVSFF